MHLKMKFKSQGGPAHPVKGKEQKLWSDPGRFLRNGPECAELEGPLFQARTSLRCPVRGAGLPGVRGSWVRSPHTASVRTGASRATVCQAWGLGCNVLRGCSPTSSDVGSGHCSDVTGEEWTVEIHQGPFVSGFPFSTLNYIPLIMLFQLS